ncbi:MAG: hypothetical protein AAF416_19200 [Pseudomonadota bacterium]
MLKASRESGTNAQLPATLSLHSAIDAEARRYASEPERRNQWREENMLKLYPREAISAALAAAAPLITSPALSALTDLL